MRKTEFTQALIDLELLEADHLNSNIPGMDEMDEKATETTNFTQQRTITMDNDMSKVNYLIIIQATPWK